MKKNRGAEEGEGGGGGGRGGGGEGEGEIVKKLYKDSWGVVEKHLLLLLPSRIKEIVEEGERGEGGSWRGRGSGGRE